MKTILIVEDEVALQDALQKVFTAEGYAVLQAFDGDEAVALAKDKKPDLVLLDLILPKKHGFDVLEAIRAMDETKQVPVLILTNLEESEYVMKAIELGARGYLIKANYALKEVLTKVKEVLG